MARTPQENDKLAYLHAVLDEVPRIYLRNQGVKIKPQTIGLDEYAENGWMIPVSVKGRTYLIHHYLNRRWTVQRNAWEIGKKVHTRIKEGRAQ